MSLTFQILGNPEADNALLVMIDSGQAVERLLFDCGDRCLEILSVSDIQSIDNLFFSHLHMDHVGGFDNFFRCTYSRDVKPNNIWGPPGTAAIMQHRFQGFMWNLTDHLHGTWHVHDIDLAKISSQRFELNEAFSVAHDEGTTQCESIITDGDGYTVEAVTMDHLTPSLAYIVREKPRQNIDTDRMLSMSLKPGPWLKQLKEATVDDETIEINGSVYSIPELRDTLIIETKGDSIAYLTDFLLDETAIDRLTVALSGCNKIVCEAQYCHEDLELAQKNYHMTTVLSATLAKKVQAKELILFHLSDRYNRLAWLEMLEEARQIFPNTHYPVHWDLTRNR